jgi:hypothetical protein
MPNIGAVSVLRLYFVAKAGHWQGVSRVGKAEIQTLQPKDSTSPRLLELRESVDELEML